MSSWKDVHKGKDGGSELAQAEAVQGQFAGNRILMQALTGYVPGEKDAVPRVKVTVFYEMGVVKLCVNEPQTDRLGFVTLDPVHAEIGAAIDAALLGGLDWRKRPKPVQGAWQGPRR